MSEFLTNEETIIWTILVLLVVVPTIVISRYCAAHSPAQANPSTGPSAPTKETTMSDDDES